MKVPEFRCLPSSLRSAPQNDESLMAEKTDPDQFEVDFCPTATVCSLFSNQILPCSWAMAIACVVFGDFWGFPDPPKIALQFWFNNPCLLGVAPIQDNSVQSLF